MIEGLSTVFYTYARVLKSLPTSLYEREDLPAACPPSAALQALAGGCESARRPARHLPAMLRNARRAGKNSPLIKGGKAAGPEGDFFKELY
jgi:hypothetical protein